MPFKIICVTGPGSTGKSTIIREPTGTSNTLEREAMCSAFFKCPVYVMQWALAAAATPSASS